MQNNELIIREVFYKVSGKNGGIVSIKFTPQFSGDDISSIVDALSIFKDSVEELYLGKAEIDYHSTLNENTEVLDNINFNDL